MKKIYACLVGNWVCLNDDKECAMGPHRSSPYLWWEENAEAYIPTKRDPELKDSAYGLDYIEICYNGKDYRINPMFIQIVTE